MNNKIIAITIGDINGIGIEILIKLWKEKKINNFVLITNVKLFIKYLNKKKIKLPIKIIKENDICYLNKSDNKLFLLFNIKSIGIACNTGIITWRKQGDFFRNIIIN